MENIVDRIIRNDGLDVREALECSRTMSDERLLDLAAQLTRKCCPKAFDTCSIVNAKSGRCPEDCKWCAQSLHHHSEIDIYPLMDTERLLQSARISRDRGIGRFSIVTSGKRLSPAEVTSICRSAETIVRECGLYLCLSAGLLTQDELARLYDAGIRRYHCNLESAPSYFGELCTTHTQSQKIMTLKAARSVGMEICSGGIIGMGETMEQRIELAFILKTLGVKSVPLNILSPIKGTALESMPLLPEEEILRTVAIFRLMMPSVRLRFAGGRARLSEKTLMAAFRAGVNAAILGDMLTTAGAEVDADMSRIKASGYSIMTPDEIYHMKNEC